MPREETLHRCVGGRYTLLEPLGRGGMGTVWRGHDELLRRDVAVKQVAVHAGAPGSPSASARERVMREAQAAARLSHPASVTVYDVLEEDGSVYIVMELLVADTLAGVVERAGPLAPADAARLGAELAGVLDAAHRQGIVHRDVKPGNVMVLPSGGVKLTDFGIASVKDDPALTATGQVLGSPSYMAPEQALGERAGPAADSWGLGATLYFAVEGRPPFERPGALSTLTAVVNDDPAPPQLAGPLAPVLQGLLAKDPGARPTPAEARPALRALAEQVSRPSAAPVAEPPLAPPDDPTATAVMDVPPPPVRAAPAPRHPPPQAVPPPAPPLPPPPAPPPAAPRPASASPRPASASPRPTPAAERQATPRGPVVAVLVAVAVLLVAVVAALSRPGDDDPRPAAAPSASTTTSTPSTTTAPTSRRTTAPAAPRQQGVPADWTTYTDPKTGYVIGRPPGWEVRPLDGTRTDIVDPSTGSYLRVDWTDTPGDSPVAAWEAQSRSFGSRHDEYVEIRIEPTTFKGFDAAIWEYAYSSRGARLHGIDLGMVTGRYGFALNFQTPEGLWEASQPTFEAFKASFVAPR